MNSVEEHIKDFNPAILKSFDFGNVLKSLLDKTEEIAKRLNEFENNRAIDAIHFAAMRKDIDDIKTILSEVVEPRKGVIAIVESHELQLKSFKDERILDKVKDNEKVVQTLVKLAWLIVGAITGLIVKIIIFPG